jgi:hypothetical protein
MIAVISVGRDNSFGHPSQEVLQNLRAKGYSEQTGTVLSRSLERGDDLLVKTCRDFMFERAENISTKRRISGSSFQYGDCSVVTVNDMWPEDTTC